MEKEKLKKRKKERDGFRTALQEFGRDHLKLFQAAIAAHSLDLNGILQEPELKSSEHQALCSVFVDVLFALRYEVCLCFLHSHLHSSS